MEKNSLKKKRCIIFGGGGFIGSHLAEDLLKQGFIVRIFDIKNFDKHNLLKILREIEIHEGDFNNAQDVKDALIGVQYVFHLISSTIPSNSVLNPTYDVETNVIPTIRLLHLCKDFSVTKFIFLSSGGTVYGIPENLPIAETHQSNPISSYGIAKRTIESYVSLYSRLWNLDACIFRLSNPYGEKQNPFGKQGVIPVFIYKALNNDFLEVWGNGGVIRDYIYINDVTSVMIQALKINTPEIIYNLGSGIGTSINEILGFIERKMGKMLSIKYDEGRNFDVPVNILDIGLIQSRFDFTPEVALNEGLDIIFNHIAKEYFGK